MEVQKIARFIPPVKAARQRNFENPFPDYSGQKITDPSCFKEQAFSLMQDIYSYYNLFPSRPRKDLYIGGAGVSYACLRLMKQLGSEAVDKQMIRDLAEKIVDASIKEVRSKTECERVFFTGDYGVFVSAALVYAELDRTEEADAALSDFVRIMQTSERLSLPRSSADELFAGRTGYLAGFLELWKRFPEHPVLLAAPVTSIVAAILDSGREYSTVRGFQASCPLMFFHYEADYVGAAHGLSGILQILLCFPGALEQFPGSLKDIQTSMDYLLSNQQPDGNFPSVFGQSSDEKDELVQWCHGAAGVLPALAKAYLVWHDEKYLAGCKKCADVIWSKGLLKKGPGICHGISGNGYAFLIMYKLTKEPEYLYRANCFGDIMLQPSVREMSRLPDNPYSLFEGISGTMCYYVDLTDPSKAYFPFFDTFTNCTASFRRRDSAGVETSLVAAGGPLQVKTSATALQKSVAVPNLSNGTTTKPTTPTATVAVPGKSTAVRNKETVLNANGSLNVSHSVHDVRTSGSRTTLALANPTVKEKTLAPAPPPLDPDSKKP